MKPTNTQQTEGQPTWKHGTDLRDDATGIYRWPHPTLAENPEAVTMYPSVTTVLDEFMAGGMRHAEHWFTAEYVNFLAEAARTKTPVPVWVDTDNEDGGETVEVAAIDLLLNKLQPPSWPKNFGMHWIKKAGPREMRKRANRGSILHDALEEWAYGLRIESNDVTDYTQGLIQAKGFTLTPDYCDQYVRQLLLWCDRHVADVLMAEAVVMNDTYGYAGTLDTVLKLQGFPELDAIGPVGMVDAKGSKSDQPSHELQGAAYFYAEHIGVPNTAERVPMIELDWMANLYVQPEGVKLRHWPRIRRCADPHECEPMHMFLHARVLWEGMYQPEHPKTMKGVPVRKVAPGQPGLPLQLVEGGKK